MNQIEIGKFIAECRKKNNLTQKQLADKLNITDRAVSKWENGKSMPDSSIMIELCNELKISVNELLRGEAIEMEDYNKKAEELLIELAKQDEEKNKKLLFAMYALMIISIVFYFIALLMAGTFIPEGPNQIAIIAISSIVLFVAIFIGLKLEVDAGYYKCKNCHHRFVPTYKEVFFSMHMGTTRYLKCPKCGKKSWSKKVMKKEEFEKE